MTKNSGPVFRRVMEALHAQQTPWPFELVVVDCGSTDGTPQFAASRGALLHEYRTEKWRYGPARDYMLERCRGEALLVMSADVIPASPDWLFKLMTPLLEGRAAAASGDHAPPPGEYVFYWDYHGSWLRSVAVRFDVAYGKIAMTCSNFALRREVWDKLRFGDCEALEDRALQVKLYEGGYPMIKVKEALSYHGHDYTWEQLKHRTESFAMGWAELGWPYTFGRLLRDLVQPRRYTIVLEALLRGKLKTWKEVVYPVAMCFMQYRGSRRAGMGGARPAHARM